MWDWRQLKWMNYLGFWPAQAKTRRGYIFSRIYGIFIIIIDSLLIGPELAGIWIGMREGTIALIVLNINQAFMGFQFMLKVLKVFWDESTIKLFIAKFDDMDKRARMLLGNEKMNKISEYREFRCWLSTLFLPVGLSVVMLWFIRPVIGLIHGSKVLILDGPVPIDISTIQGWLIMFMLEACHVVTAVAEMILFDTVMFCIFDILLLQYDVLNEVLSSIKFMNSEKELRFCINFHQDIVRLAKDINDFIKNVILMQCIIFTTVICLSIYEFTSGQDSLWKRLNSLLLCACEVYQSLVYGWVCQELQDKNVEVIRAAYDSDWYNASPRERRCLIMLMNRSQISQNYGIIAFSNLNTFIAVLKSAFSYYQFLDTMFK